MIEGNVLVGRDKFITHAWKGDVVDPGGVKGHELGRAWCEEFGDAVVVFLGGGDHPAREREHEEEGGDAFGEVRYIWGLLELCD